MRGIEQSRTFNASGASLYYTQVLEMLSEGTNGSLVSDHTKVLILQPKPRQIRILQHIAELIPESFFNFYSFFKLVYIQYFVSFMCTA